MMDLHRRALLQGSICFVGFSLLGHAPAAAAQAAARGPLPLDQVDSFLALQPDGSLIVYSG
jgi:hypothetical protein